MTMTSENVIQIHVKLLQMDPRTLAALRDTLLHKLISSELHVKDTKQLLKDKL